METAAVPRDARKTTKAKPKRNKAAPLKVVYISNPMKVKTSASQFRALVQELTGQDAAEWPVVPEELDAVRVVHDDDHNKNKNNDEYGRQQCHQTLPAAGGNFMKNISINSSGGVLPDDYYHYYNGAGDHGNNHMRSAALEGHAPPTTIGDFSDHQQMLGGISSDHSMYVGPSSDVIFGMDGDCYGGRRLRQQQQMMILESLESLIDCSSSDAHVPDDQQFGGGDAV